MTSCRANFCTRDCPEGYEYCDDHHLLRDRDGDQPGEMPSLDDRW